MIFTQVAFGTSSGMLFPQDVLRENWDCIWMHFAPRQVAGPLKSQVFQWLDWKVQGAVTDFIVRGGLKRTQTTFIAMLGKITVPYLALEPTPSPGWAAFRENCAGLKIKSLLVLCEDPKTVKELKAQLSRTTKLEFPSQVFWGVEQEVP